MPNCDGYEFAELLQVFSRENNLQTPILVACTGNVEQTQVEKAFRSGFDELVAKPVSLETIKAILREVIIIEA